MSTAVFENATHNRVIMVIGNFMALRYNVGLLTWWIGLFNIGDISE